MEKQKINTCKKINQISLAEILLNFGIIPAKKKNDEIWYLNPFFEEKTASFKLNISQNSWILFSDFTKGSVVDFLIRYLNTDVKGVIKWMNNNPDFSSFQKQKENLKVKNLPKKYEIINVKKIQHPALIEFLNSRKINFETHYLQEIHYEISGKKYFGIAFENISGGFEIRNKYVKLCLGKKDISTFKNNSNTVKIFEGFLDYFSFLKHFKISVPNDFDVIVLNSTSLIFSIKNHLNQYSNIELYLDNDDAGRLATRTILQWHINAKDCSVQYENFKDFNDFLLSKDCV